MTKLQVINARKMEKVLFKLGFERVRQKGSHVFYRHPDGRTTTIPHHSRSDLVKPLIKEILREIELSTAEFDEYLKKM